MLTIVKCLEIQGKQTTGNVLCLRCWGWRNCSFLKFLRKQYTRNFEYVSRREFYVKFAAGSIPFAAPDDCVSNTIILPHKIPRSPHSFSVLKTLFSHVQKDLVEYPTNWDRELTANEMSGRGHTVKYFKLQIACQYEPQQDVLSLRLNFYVCSFIDVWQGFQFTVQNRFRTLKRYEFWISFSLRADLSRYASRARQILVSPQSTISKRLHSFALIMCNDLRECAETSGS